MISLSWEQVNTWRLARHFLLRRAERDQMLEVVSRIGAVHAQVMSAAELQLWARVDGLTADDVSDALWTRRTLVKTWAVRGTLHLLAASELPLYAAALEQVIGKFYRRNSWLRYNGVTLDEYQAIIDGVCASLGAEGLTREQLADAIVNHTGNETLHERLRSGWGVLFKSSAHAGCLCFGPSQGQNVTFVNPTAWLPEYIPVDAGVALKSLAKRYLGAYGPATFDDFGHWFGMQPPDAKKLFRSLGADLVEVNVEGWSAMMLADQLADLQATSPVRSVRLLPLFDPYVIANARHSHYLLDPAHKARVYRNQGWISPVVLVDGRMAGVWEQQKKSGSKTASIVTLQITMFSAPDAFTREGIGQEAQRLEAFIGASVTVDYVTS
jgi:uncharacterized protein YcaQ